MSRISETLHESASTFSHHLLLVGAGPRSTIQTEAEISFMLLYRDHFEQLMSLGGHYRIETTIVEKQSRVATGVSFSRGQTGMANTGIEDDIEFSLPVTGRSEQEVAVIKKLLSYKHRYDLKFGQNPEAYYDELKQLNLPGSAMFKRAVGPMSSTPSGQLDHSRAYLMRKTMGEEEYDHFNLVRQIAEQNLPFYKLHIQHSTLLDEISVSDFTKPAARILNINKNHWRWSSADIIRMNTGTTLKHPIVAPDVRDLTFCQSMNIADMRLYFNSRGLLGPDDMVIPGVKILCGGLSLSSLDQLSALDGIMNLFEVDDKALLGYKVTSCAKRLYQGAITFISRTPGKACPPRHSFSPEWTQDTPVMGSTKHLHSLFLHENGEDVYSLWYDILKATVARASNVTPADMEKRWSTEELLYSQFQETTKFLNLRRKAGMAELQNEMDAKELLLRESTKTNSGAWREAALSVILGYGVENELNNAIAEMEELAPITFKERHTMLLHRAQQNAITNPRVVLKGSNKKLMSNYRNLMSLVTASPVEIHSMFHLLIDAGIARCVLSSYSDISAAADGQHLFLQEELYNVLIVSPVFDRNSDPAVKSLEGQIRPIHESAPGYGEVGKFRQFISPSGNPLAIEENGLGGAGFQLQEGVAKGSTIGAFADDINNRWSSASTAASFATRRMALAHLKAAGVSCPLSKLAAIYESQKANERAYNEEVGKFEKYFDEAYEISAYLKAIKKAAGDDSGLFRTLYDDGITRKGRMLAVEKMKSSSSFVEREVARIYAKQVKTTPPFNPPYRDEYLKRFVDTTPTEDKAAYEEAFRLAEKVLSTRKAPIVYA